MKRAYPVIMTKGEKYIVVYVPDFDINTQGINYADAMEMARDAIGLVGIDMEDAGEELPIPTEYHEVKCEAGNDIIALVDVDFAEYRRANDMRTVRRNVSLPSWLNAKANKAGINVSAVLQIALEKELGIV